MKNRRRWIKYGISFVILVASLYYALLDIDLNHFFTVLAQVRWQWLIYSALCTIAAHVLRAQRWRILLEPIVPGVSLLNAFSATMVGYLFNLTIPRSGELIRPYILSRNEKFSLSSSLATIVLERVLDILSILVLGIVVLFFYQEEIQLLFPNFSENILTALLVPLIGIVVFLFVLLRTAIVQRILEYTLKKVSPLWYRKMVEYIDRFKAGFSILSAPRKYIGIGTITAVMWLFYILSLYLLFFAFDFQYRSPLTLVDANFLCFVTSIGIAIAPTPGAVGVYHSLVKVTLNTLYDISPAIALAYGTVAHAVGMYGVALLLGGIFFIREQVRGSLWRREKPVIEHVSQKQAVENGAKS